MKADLPSFELVAATSLADALARLDASPGTYRPLAGGTDVMVLFAAGKLAHTRWLSIWGIPELRGIVVENDHVTMGALTTFTDVQAHPVVREEFPMLCQAGFETGGIAIQNRGTIGGNIVNASPAADSPPALLAYGAELELSSTKGARWVAYDGFHTGYKEMQLAPNELVTRVRVPRARGKERIQFYRKVGPRRAQAISKVCFAGCAEMTNGKIAEVRIALGGVAPIIPRCPKTEAVLREGKGGAEWRGRAREALEREIAPIDDIRSTARYRGRVAANLLMDFAVRLEHRVGLAPKAG